MNKHIQQCIACRQLRLPVHSVSLRSVSPAGSAIAIVGNCDCQQAIHYIVYRLPAIAAILFDWIRMKVTCLT